MTFPPEPAWLREEGEHADFGGLLPIASDYLERALVGCLLINRTLISEARGIVIPKSTMPDRRGRLLRTVRTGS